MAHQLNGQLISITQQDKARLEGILDEVNAQAGTLTLTDVIFIGTEDREAPNGFIPYLDQTFPSLTIQRAQVLAITRLSARTPKPVAPPVVPVQQPEPQPQQSQKDGSDFNTASLNIVRDQTSEKTYSKSNSFFDQTGDAAVYKRYNDVDTFGESLRRMGRSGGHQNNNNMNNRNNNRNNNNNAGFNNNRNNSHPGGYRNNNNYDNNNNRNNNNRHNNNRTNYSSGNNNNNWRNNDGNGRGDWNTSANQ